MRELREACWNFPNKVRIFMLGRGVGMDFHHGWK
jgi:hypothetical protein